MSAIFLRARCAIKPGRLDDLRAEAKLLREQTQGAAGVLVYGHYLDEANNEFVGIEGYESEARLLEHVANNDFGPLFDTMDILLFEVYGDPSEGLLDNLKAMATLQLFPNL